jgi:hypothetical protein
MQGPGLLAYNAEELDNEPSFIEARRRSEPVSGEETSRQ